MGQECSVLGKAPAPPSLESEVQEKAKHRGSGLLGGDLGSGPGEVTQGAQSRAVTRSPNAEPCTLPAAPSVLS